MNEVINKSLNGVNLDQLFGTIEAVKSDPEMAAFNFRSRTKWIDGGHCRTTIEDFFGTKQEDKSREKPFILEGDEPSVLLGNNHGPNAVEFILHALASCLTVGIVYNAAALGIEINALNFELEGQLDLQGFLGLSNTIRPGYRNIKVKIMLDSDAPEDQILALSNHVKMTSPVLDIISNPVPVEIKFQ